MTAQRRSPTAGGFRAVPICGLLMILLITSDGAASDGAPRGAGAFALMPATGASEAREAAGQATAAARPSNGTPVSEATAGPTEDDIRALLRRMRSATLRGGVRAATFERLASGIRLEPSVIARLGSQPELVRPVSSYIRALVDDSRVAEGRQRLAEHGDLLRRIEAAYGVPAPVLVAIWGIESRYGTRTGTIRVLDALATLAAAGGRRQAFWEQQLVAAFRIVERGDVQTGDLVGSWAGALGHTQFIPSTYLARAVDFDGDGRRDIVSSVPDALASAAHHLRASGWMPGVPWGVEVALPAGFDYAFSAPGRARPVEVWDQLKVRRADGAALPRGAGDMQLILPAGAEGPAFLVTRSYRAILGYNNAMSYAIAVSLLAERISGGPGTIAAWPTEDAPLKLDERKEMQRHLVGLGYDVGGIDGIMGNGTRDAIRAYQAGSGLAEDGHPDRDLLERLRVDMSDSQHIP
ncbi:MAG: lytic murein transglycosylase [Hyphomicrobiaceae bacterium]